mgnify:CR=1 FL=1
MTDVKCDGPEEDKFDVKGASPPPLLRAIDAIWARRNRVAPSLWKKYRAALWAADQHCVTLLHFVREYVAGEGMRCENIYDSA